MQNDTPITEYSFRSGAERGSRLTLFPGRLVHDGGNVVEHIPIGQLASVRVAFLREQRRIKWAIILVVVSAILHIVAGPLQHVADVAAQEVAEHAKREKVTGGIPEVLNLSFRAMARGAAMLPGIGWLLVLAAGGLGGIYWWGRTELTLSFGSAEREYVVWGRDPMLFQFGDSISSRLAELTG